MRWLSGLLVLVAMLSAAPAFAWEGDTVKVGGPGGGEFHDPCESGAMVGMSYKAGKDLNVIWMTCQPMTDGKLHGHPADEGAWGYYGGGKGYEGRSGSIEGTPGAVVQAIYVHSANVLHEYWLLCRNLLTGEHFQTDWSQTNGGS